MYTMVVESVHTCISLLYYSQCKIYCTLV